MPQSPTSFPQANLPPHPAKLDTAGGASRIESSLAFVDALEKKMKQGNPFLRYCAINADRGAFDLTPKSVVRILRIGAALSSTSPDASAARSNSEDVKSGVWPEEFDFKQYVFEAPEWATRQAVRQWVDTGSSTRPYQGLEDQQIAMICVATRIRIFFEEVATAAERRGVPVPDKLFGAMKTVHGTLDEVIGMFSGYPRQAFDIRKAADEAFQEITNGRDCAPHETDRSSRRAARLGQPIPGGGARSFVDESPTAGLPLGYFPLVGMFPKMFLPLKDPAYGPVEPRSTRERGTGDDLSSLAAEFWPSGSEGSMNVRDARCTDGSKEDALQRVDPRRVHLFSEGICRGVLGVGESVPSPGLQQNWEVLRAAYEASPAFAAGASARAAIGKGGGGTSEAANGTRSVGHRSADMYGPFRPDGDPSAVTGSLPPGVSNLAPSESLLDAPPAAGSGAAATTRVRAGFWTPACVPDALRRCLGAPEPAGQTTSDGGPWAPPTRKPGE